MLPVKGTIFVKLQFILGIPAVFTGSIIAPLTLTALQGYQFNHLLFACHNSTSSFNQISASFQTPENKSCINLTVIFCLKSCIIKLQNENAKRFH